MKINKFNILILLLILSAVLSMINVFQNKKQKSSSISFDDFSISIGKGIYIMEINSPIYYDQGGNSIISKGTGVKYWIKTLDSIRKRDDVSGLLLRINSPGGTVGASQELFAALKRFKASGKHIVVSVVDLCASGAYYAALPADKIFANSGSLVGSIGVIISSMEFSKLLEKWGIKQNTIKSGQFKDILSFGRPMKDKEKKLLQETVNEMYKIFLNDVIESRGGNKNKKKITAIADGRILSASQALKAGLIDDIGDGEAAKKALAELCDLDYDSLKIITQKEENIKKILGGLNIKSPLDTFFNRLLEYKYEGPR